MSLQEVLPTLVEARSTLAALESRLLEAERDEELALSSGKLHPLINELTALIETAERAFTVAVVGEFKVGKSTLLNGLLGLSGDAALSAQDSPDTARSILLRGREAGDPEARLHFDDGRPGEDVSWVEAKRLTSQVSQEESPAIAERARRLREVEYFAASPLLARFHFNDLPGTGAHHRLRHTEIAHQRMKLADAVLWVVAGDREPGADARQDLAVLAQYSQKVLPVINVIEDPSADPPIPREIDMARDIARTVSREFRSYFSPLLEEPLLISARVLEVERAKEEPDPGKLEETGYSPLIQALEQLLESHDRRLLLCSAASATLDRVVALLIESADRVERLRNAVRSEVEELDAKLDEIGEVQMMLRGQISTLARSRAAEICRRIAQQADRFVEVQLDGANVLGLFKALSKKSRKKLEDELRQDFEIHYLRLGDRPNWLDVVTGDFARDVRTLVIPEWRRVARSHLDQLEKARSVTASTIDMETIGADLQRAIIAAFQHLFIAGGVGALALMAAFPVVAALAVAAAALPVIGNPFEKKRRQAKERVRAEIEMQQEVMASKLQEGAWKSIEATEEAVRTGLEGGRESSSGRLQEVTSLFSALNHGADRLTAMRDGLERLLDTGRDR
jgi:dynamin family protein